MSFTYHLDQRFHVCSLRTYSPQRWTGGSSYHCNDKRSTSLYIMIMIYIVNNTYFQIVALISSSWCLYRSSAICRLVGLSPAWNRQNTKVFLLELDCLVLHTCSAILKDPWPLSPPSLIHISSSGMSPSSHVPKCQECRQRKLVTSSLHHCWDKSWMVHILSLYTIWRPLLGPFSLLFLTGHC